MAVSLSNVSRTGSEAGLKKDVIPRGDRVTSDST